MVRTQKFDLDTDTTLGGNNASDYIAPSQKAIKNYVDNHSGGAPAWGNITGTLSNQTDLQNALNNKVNGVVAANGIIIGTNADADYGVVVGNNSGLGNNLSGGVVIGSNSSSNVDDSVIIGENSNYAGIQNGSIVIGCGNEVISNEGGQSIVIGRDLSTGTAAIGEKKLIVGLGSAYELCDLSTGLIPDARISSNIARTSQIPTESTVSGWGFTKNTGTVTSVNNTSPDANGNVTLSIPEQVQADWNETDTTSKAYIQNKPTIPTVDQSFDGTSTNAESGVSILGLLQTIYPVGSVYLSTNATCPLASLFGTWTLVSSGKALWTGTGSNGGSTISAGLPNITGYASINACTNTTDNGALYRDDGSGVSIKNPSWSSSKLSPLIHIDASRSNSIYGNSTTVQPPAYVVNVWRRTA